MTYQYTCQDVTGAIDDYVDELLKPAAHQAVARHLVACEACSRQVVAERELRARLRAVRLDPGHQASLVAGLLALQAEQPSGAVPQQPSASTPKARSRSPRCIVTVRADAPAQYSRSSRGPAAGFLALAGVVAFALATVWTAPQRRAPQYPYAPQVAQERSVARDVFVSAHLTSTASSGEPGNGRETSHNDTGIHAPRTSSGRMTP